MSQKNAPGRLKPPRRRRQPASAATIASPPSAIGSAAVFERVVPVILDCVDSRQRAGDAIVAAALRGCLRQIPPRGVESDELYRKLQSVAEDDRVSTRAFRAAVADLLDQLEQHEPGPSNPFLSYLTLLSS